MSNATIDFDGFVHMDEIADLLPHASETGAVRIREACFFDGEESRWVVQFFRMSGSIARASFDRHTTETKVSFIPVASYEYHLLSQMA